MTVGLLTLELFLPASGSLKDKRQVLSGLLRRLRNKQNVAAAEVGHQDLWQRATVAFVSVSSSQPIIERIFDDVVAEAERAVPGEIVRAEREFLGA